MKYATEIKFDFNNTMTIFIDNIAANSTILEFGPASGRLTRYLKEEKNCDMYIVELDKEAGMIAAQSAKDYVIGDIQDYVWVEQFAQVQFDYILFADVLEHLTDAVNVMKRAAQLLKPTGQICLSVPNIAHNSVIIDMINNKFEYTSTGIMDNTHVHFYTKDSLDAFIKECGLYDFIAICVPTPLDAHQQPDISYVRDSAIAISEHLKKNTMVVLESTTYPGTTEELIKPILENGSGLKCGEDFYLGFSPERVDPGNLIYKTKNTPKVVGAIGKDATQVIAAMYRAVLQSDIHEVSSPAVAEMEKILENTYRNINIGLVNELAQLCHKMGISIWEVIDAAKTKPYGFQPFYPGPGLGGHCIPLDPYYLSWKAREYGFHTSMIESSMMINDKMPEYTIERLGDLLNKQKKPLNGAKILQLGVAYKNDIDDYRESPALAVRELLNEEGCAVDYFDPFVSSYRYRGKQYQSIPEITPAIVKKYDAVIVTAGHTQKVDYQMIADNAKVIFDTKNVMKNISKRDNIEVL